LNLPGHVVQDIGSQEPGDGHHEVE
jgi:hypothetical protein